MGNGEELIPINIVLEEKRNWGLGKIITKIIKYGTSFGSFFFPPLILASATTMGYEELKNYYENHEYTKRLIELFEKLEEILAEHGKSINELNEKIDHLEETQNLSIFHIHKILEKLIGQVIPEPDENTRESYINGIAMTFLELLEKGDYEYNEQEQFLLHVRLNLTEGALEFLNLLTEFHETRFPLLSQLYSDLGRKAIFRNDLSPHLDNQQIEILMSGADNIPLHGKSLNNIENILINEFIDKIPQGLKVLLTSYFEQFMSFGIIQRSGSETLPNNPDILRGNLEKFIRKPLNSTIQPILRKFYRNSDFISSISDEL